MDAVELFPLTTSRKVPLGSLALSWLKRTHRPSDLFASADVGVDSALINRPYLRNPLPTSMSLGTFRT